MERIEIKGEQRTIQRVFCDEFSLRIPEYQRPYAWEEEHAEELFDDLVHAMGDGDEEVTALGPYFLGSIVLVKSEVGRKAEVIDGQQRLTTMTILLAALRACTEPEFSESLANFIEQPAVVVAGIQKGYRLTPRESDKVFFRRYVQSPGGIEKLEQSPETLKAPGEKLSHSEKKMRDNALALKKKVLTLSQEQRHRLAQFLITRCYLVVVSTPDNDSAYRIFTVLNDRGLDLSHADILKAQIIGKLEGDEQRRLFADKWEKAESYLGRDSFKNLFGHLRMIRHRKKPQGTVLNEFRTHFMPEGYDPAKLVDEVILPSASAHGVIRYETWEGADDASVNRDINDMFRWLKRLGHWEWIPLAIHFLNTSPDAKTLLRFLQALERLGAFLLVCRWNINKRIRRYAQVLDAIDQGMLFDEGSQLQLTKDEQKQFIEALDGEIYLEANFRLYVLLRLDRVLGDALATYDAQKITVEHVFPQSPAAHSQWLKDFATEEDRRFTHRLGNLVLLSRQRNSQASNWEFPKKKACYFSPKHAVSTFALTSQVLNENEWTPAVVARRQKQLLSKLKEWWSLAP